MRTLATHDGRLECTFHVSSRRKALDYNASNAARQWRACGKLPAARYNHRFAPIPNHPIRAQRPTPPSRCSTTGRPAPRSSNPRCPRSYSRPGSSRWCSSGTTRVSAEKLLKTDKTILLDLISKGEDKPTLVPSCDKRDALNNANVFDKLD